MQEGKSQICMVPPPPASRDQRLEYLISTIINLIRINNRYPFELEISYSKEVHYGLTTVRTTYENKLLLEPPTTAEEIARFLTRARGADLRINIKRGQGTLFWDPRPRSDAFPSEGPRDRRAEPQANEQRPRHDRRRDGQQRDPARSPQAEETRKVTPRPPATEVAPQPPPERTAEKAKKTHPRSEKRPRSDVPEKPPPMKLPTLRAPSPKRKGVLENHRRPQSREKGHRHNVKTMGFETKGLPVCVRIHCLFCQEAIMKLHCLPPTNCVHCIRMLYTVTPSEAGISENTSHLWTLHHEAGNERRSSVAATAQEDIAFSLRLGRITALYPKNRVGQLSVKLTECDRHHRQTKTAKKTGSCIRTTQKSNRRYQLSRRMSGSNA